VSRKITHSIQTNYLDKVYSKQFLDLVPEAIKIITAYRKKHPFDAIAFTGSSGAAIAFPLSFFLKLPLIHIRKDDKNHYGKPIEGTISSKKYLIVDDLIASGATIRNIVKTINKEYKHKAKPVGIYLYDSDRNFPAFDKIPIIA
jgi:adenine/guanine phosphoribosyltransferase-like PRPP-binding protein